MIICARLMEDSISVGRGTYTFLVVVGWMIGLNMEEKNDVLGEVFNTFAGA